MDPIISLRDVCVVESLPLPVFDIKEEENSTEPTQFKAICQVASIKRYGVASTKKDARKNAAAEMLKVINLVRSNAIPSENETIEKQIIEKEETRYKKLKTYRELTESGEEYNGGKLIADRHYFFEKFNEVLKESARRILDPTTKMATDRERVENIFKLFNIKPKIHGDIPVITNEPIIFMDLNLEYDAVFAGTEDTIYQEIVEYFTDMI